MKTGFKVAIIALLVLAGIAFLGHYIATHPIPVLQPKGLIGLKERNLLITCTVLMLIVVVPVLILAYLFAWKYREKNKRAKYSPDFEHNDIAEMCWWGVPIIIIAIISIITWKSSHELNPFKPLVSEEKPVQVQVVALDWKWLFIYPEYKIAVVNHLEVPEQTPINFEITADAPMNSFWIPDLGGMIMAMPGMRSKLYLQASSKGMYVGRSAQISGKGFSGMFFDTHVTSKQGFEEWIKKNKKTNKVLTLDAYNDLVKPSDYHPVEIFEIGDVNLFDLIIDKYLKPNHKLKEPED